MEGVIVVVVLVVVAVMGLTIHDRRRDAIDIPIKDSFSFRLTAVRKVDTLGAWGGYNLLMPEHKGIRLVPPPASSVSSKLLLVNTFSFDALNARSREGHHNLPCLHHLHYATCTTKPVLSALPLLPFALRPTMQPLGSRILRSSTSPSITCKPCQDSGNA